MQIKIAFRAIFVYRWGFLAGGSAKRTPKRHEHYRGPRRAGQPTVAKRKGENIARPLAKQNRGGNTRIPE